MAGKVRRSADLANRLEAASRKALHNQPETLRGLLDESGFYEGIGGVDEAIREAEKQGKNISKSPEETLVMGVRDPRPIYTPEGMYVGLGGIEEPVAYRTLFPSIDYSRGDLELPVNYEREPVLTRLNSTYFPKQVNPSLSDFVHWSYYNEPYIPKDTAIASARNRDLLRDLTNYREKMTPANQLHRLNMQEALIRREANPITTPYTVIDAMPPRQRLSSVMHEVGHHAHRPVLWTLFEQGGNRGAVPVTSRMAYQIQQPTTQTIPGMQNVGIADEIPYRMTPIEADQMMADIKRAYAEATGNLVRTRQDARKALEWFSQQPDDPRFVARPIHAKAYADPVSFIAQDPDAVLAGDKVNPNIFLDRMRELYGLGGAAILSQLLDDEEQ